MREERKETLQKLCLVFRNKLIDLLYSVQTGHPGGSLSCTDHENTYHILFPETMS